GGRPAAGRADDRPGVRRVGRGAAAVLGAQPSRLAARRRRPPERGAPRGGGAAAPRAGRGDHHPERRRAAAGRRRARGDRAARRPVPGGVPGVRGPQPAAAAGRAAPGRQPRLGGARRRRADLPRRRRRPRRGRDRGVPGGGLRAVRRHAQARRDLLRGERAAGPRARLLRADRAGGRPAGARLVADGAVGVPVRPARRAARRPRRDRQPGPDPGRRARAGEAGRAALHRARGPARRARRVAAGRAAPAPGAGQPPDSTAVAAGAGEARRPGTPGGGAAPAVGGSGRVWTVANPVDSSSFSCRLRNTWTCWAYRRIVVLRVLARTAAARAYSRPWAVRIRATTVLSLSLPDFPEISDSPLCFSATGQFGSGALSLTTLLRYPQS